MAMAMTVGKGLIQVVPTGAADWDSQSFFPDGVILKGIRVWGTAATDQIIVRDGSDTGVVIFGGVDVLGGGMKDDYSLGLQAKPYIKLSEQVMTTAADISIIFLLR